MGAASVWIDVGSRIEYLIMIKRPNSWVKGTLREPYTSEEWAGQRWWNMLLDDGDELDVQCRQSEYTAGGGDSVAMAKRTQRTRTSTAHPKLRGQSIPMDL